MSASPNRPPGCRRQPDLAQRHRRQRHVEHDLRPSLRRYGDRQRVVADDPLGAPRGGHQRGGVRRRDAEAPCLGRKHGPSAGGTEVVRVSDRHQADPVTAGPLDRQTHRLRAGQLAHPAASVDDQGRSGVVHNVQLTLPGDAAGGQPVDVHGDEHHAVRADTA
jgi:hypothetical protein